MKANSNDIKRLEKFEKIIRKIAREFGLDFFETEFLIIPNEKMLEIMAYRLPGNYSHWSFGRDYEIQRTRYEYGFGLPYEVVLNSKPAKAYLMENNPFTLQLLVIAHVYAHNDFMKNNLYFKDTRRDMVAQAEAASERFNQYEKDYGIDLLEKTIDAAQAIEYHLGFSLFKKEKEQERLRQEEERKKGKRRQLKSLSAFDYLYRDNNQKKDDFNKEQTLKTLNEDVIGFIAEHSKNLQDWQRDVLFTVREQMEYLFPQIETKIMNEGWATYWHEKIMYELFKRKYLTDKDHGIFNHYHSRAIASNRLQINPYLVGSFLFKDIEDRWNRGAFGEEYEKLSSASREKWNLNLGKGLEKIFDVRRMYNDQMFLWEFLTKELVEKLDLYIYKEIINEQTGDSEYVIVERNWKKIRDLLVRSKCFTFPVIVVDEERSKKENSLYLEQIFDGIPLDEDYAKKTMEHIYFLWGNDVFLLTYEKEEDEEDKEVLLFNDSSKFKKVLYFYSMNKFEKKYL